MTARVRWRPGVCGNLLGYVGTLPFWSFQIYQPGDPEHGQYKLMAQLPGVGTAAARSSNPDELKAEAERWLEGFVASIGARFPHTSEPAQPSDTREWDEPDEQDEPELLWNPGPEADDQGGASEHPYAITEDDRARG